MGDLETILFLLFLTILTVCILFNFIPVKIHRYTKCYFVNDTIDYNNNNDFFITITRTGEDTLEGSYDWNESYYNTSVVFYVIENDTSDTSGGYGFGDYGYVIALNYSRDAYEDIEISNDNSIEIECPMYETISLWRYMLGG